MPLEMRPRRPIFAQAGNPPAIASSAGAVPTPAGGAPGAVNPQASGQRAPAALTGSAPLGPTSGVTQLGKGQQNSSGALGAGALAGTQPLGGTRATTAGNVGLGSSMPATSQALAANYGQLGGATAKSAPSAAPPLSRGTGGGGKARTTSDVGAGRPKDSSLMPAAALHRRSQARSAASAGDGVAGQPDPQPASKYKYGDVVDNNAGRTATGLFNGVTFIGTPSGTTPEGYNIFQAPGGDRWAETQFGWMYVGSGASAYGSNSTYGNGAEGGPPSSPYGSNSSYGNGVAGSASGLVEGNGQGGGGAGSGGGQAPRRKYSNLGPQPPAGASGGGSGGGGQGQGQGQGQGGQGYSAAAGQKAQEIGQDPFVVQAALDAGYSLESITRDGIAGIEDGDFGISGDAEWNDINDDEAGMLYNIGQRANENRTAWKAQQGMQNVDALIEQLFSRIGQMQSPGINQQVIQGQVDANRSRLMEEQSRTLGASMTSAAASGLSPEAQQAGGYQMMKDYGIAGAQQEAQTRMSAEMANLQGRQMQYAQQINMLTQLLTLPMLSAQQAMGIQAQLAQLQNSMNAEKEMATWQTNQVTGYDFGREMLGAGIQGGITAGSKALGKKLGG